MSIDRLNQGTPAAGSSIPFGDGSRDQRASLTDVAEVLQDLVTAFDDKKTQYAAPVTGATVTCAPALPGGGVFLLIQPLGTLAALTVKLPSSPHDRQEVLVVTTQTLTALTVNGNGATVNGAPSTLAANSATLFRYDGVLGVWFAVASGAGLPASGTEGQVLTIVTGVPAWATPATPVVNFDEALSRILLGI